MNSKIISHILNHDSYTQKCFQGFGNPDVALPEITSYPAVFVLNTASFFSKGEHWCVVCMEKNGICYFFDPLGKNPSEYGFTSIFHNDCNQIMVNSKQVQNNSSRTCGHHCIYFIKKYSFGLHPEIILDSYSDSTRRNDNMVHDYVRRQYGDVIATIQV
jgi:hypothetical protein